MDSSFGGRDEPFNPTPEFGSPITAPVAFYINGAPRPVDRDTAGLILAFRPGALFVVSEPDD